MKKVKFLYNSCEVIYAEQYYNSIRIVLQWYYNSITLLLVSMQEGVLGNLAEKTKGRRRMRKGSVRHGFCGGFGKE
jgi:hypothetical protein